MREKLLTVAALFSTAALVAVIFLWAASYYRVFGFSNVLFNGAKSRGVSGIWSTGGRLMLDTVRHTDVSRWPGFRGITFSNYRPEHNLFVDQPFVTRWHALGFRCAQLLTPSGDGTLTEWAAIAIPYWPIAVLLSLTPVYVVRRKLLERRRRLTGHCRKCGYDLRATPGHCPECGTLAATSPAALA